MSVDAANLFDMNEQWSCCSGFCQRAMISMQSCLVSGFGCKPFSLAEFSKSSVLATVLCHFLGFRPGKRHASSAMSEAARVGLGKENLVTEF